MVKIRMQLIPMFKEPRILSNTSVINQQWFSSLLSVSVTTGLEAFIRDQDYMWGRREIWLLLVVRIRDHLGSHWDTWIYALNWLWPLDYSQCPLSECTAPFHSVLYHPPIFHGFYMNQGFTTWSFHMEWFHMNSTWIDKLSSGSNSFLSSLGMRMNIFICHGSFRV